MRLTLKDWIVKRGLDIIHGYVQLWARENNGVLPPADTLAPGGAVGLEHPDWPSDPYTGQAFTVGSGTGHFSYSPNPDGDCTLGADLRSVTEPYEISDSAPFISDWWRDQMVYSGVQTILRGIEQYTMDNNDVYPPVGEVNPGGAVGAAGMSIGDFQYTIGAGGYTLSVHEVPFLDPKYGGAYPEFYTAQ